MVRARFSLVGLFLLLSAAPMAATETDFGAPVGLHQIRHGSLLLRTAHPDLFLPAPNLDTDVEIRVTGLVARAQVRQSFHNPTEQWVEGVYAFPLPPNAAVDHLRMVIGERVIEGEIHEREQARKIYQQAKIEGKKASLLEQERPNLFTTSVANLGPDETIEVVIEYQQELRYEQGRFQLRFPMVVAPRYVPGGSTAATISQQDSAADDFSCDETPGPTLQFSGSGWAIPNPQVPDTNRVTPLVIDTRGKALYPLTLSLTLEAGLPLASVRSPSHRLHIENRDPEKIRVELEDLTAPSDRDFVLEWEPEPGTDPRAALFSEIADGEQYLLLMVVPPHGQDAARARLPRETLFVIDTSGSMQGASIRQARQALLMALDRLRPGDYFNVIEFNSSPSRLFPASVPYAPAELERARSFVEGLRADGGTEMAAALAMALGSATAPVGLSQVIFITDGSVANEDQLFGQIHDQLGDRRLFTVGIGSAPNSHFMRQAADFGRGTFTYVADTTEVVDRIGELFRKLESPVLHDIEVIWDDPTAETLPHPIGDLYLGEPVQVAAHLLNGASEVTVRGFRGNDPWETRFQVDGGTGNNGIAKLWARRKIDALMKEAIVGDPGEDTRRQVIELALHHHLVSKYTSLVAVDKTPSRPQSEPLSPRPMPVQLPAGFSPENAHAVLPKGGTASRFLLLLGTLLLFGSAWLSRAQRQL